MRRAGHRDRLYRHGHSVADPEQTPTGRTSPPFREVPARRFGPASLTRRPDLVSITHLAVGFSDTFDTAITDDRVIHSSSVQGQLLRQVYHDDQKRLDGELAMALAEVPPVFTESRQDKPYGKPARYPLGTVAVLGEPRRLVFAIAYGTMGNDLVAHAPVAELWHCFTKLWDAVYRHGQRGALSVPLMGSGLLWRQRPDPRSGWRDPMPSTAGTVAGVWSADRPVIAGTAPEGPQAGEPAGVEPVRP
jgi:hypothetical protein